MVPSAALAGGEYIISLRASQPNTTFSLQVTRTASAVVFPLPHCFLF